MAGPKWVLSDEAVEAVAQGRHNNPFEVLGLQQQGKTWIARCFIPHADIVTAQTLAGRELGVLEQRGHGGAENHCGHRFSPQVAGSDAGGICAVRSADLARNAFL